MEPIASFSGLASGLQWRDLVEQIVKLESARRLTPVTSRISAQERRKDGWSEYSSLVSKLDDATDALRDGSAFGVLTTSVEESAVTGRALLSATATSSAAPGNYQIEVIELASSAKLSGGPVVDPTASLNISGTFFINGSAVDIAATDSLNSVRDKINAANRGTTASGVSATILSTSATSYNLILTSTQTGSRGIELVDGAGGVLEDLGILTGTQTANLSPTDSSQTQTQRFASTTSSIASMLGLTAPPATTTIKIDGQKITVDLVNDTLLTLMNKVTAQGGSATIVSESVGGRTMQRLSVDGMVTADTDAGADPIASQRIVELLGFVQGERGNNISAGTDATVVIDGFKINRRTNSISDAIQGVTLDLLASDAAQRTLSVTGAGVSLTVDPRTIEAGTYNIALSGTTSITGVTIDGEAAVWDEATNTIRGAAGSRFAGLELAYSGTATSGSIGSVVVSGDIAVDLNITRDLDSTVAAVEEFATAYNALVGFVDEQRASKGPLYSDGSLRSMMSSLRNVLITSVEGLSPTSQYSRAAVVGVALNRDGILEVDTEVLKEALSTNLADVRAVFSTIGTASDGEVSFVTSSAATQPGSYAVEITAAASLGSHTGTPLAGGVYSASNGISDTITITDSASGLTHNYVVAEGATIDSVVAGLESLFGLNGMSVNASNIGGALSLSTGSYGSSSSITLSGSALAGLGMTAGTYTGSDVQGTIGGLAATGSGQILSAVDGGVTEGLSIIFRGSTARSAGTIAFAKGLGGMMEAVTEAMTDPVDGTIQSHVDGLETSMDSLNSRVATIEAQLERHRVSLIQQFTRMEVMLSQLQSQGSWLTSQISALQPPS
ncbi:MAG TPA: flagellar filament capping protein FliD [Longimicrobiaceae bacterium]|nr:flagellar filament capping protein FliD [Longimicrobiaceae bacterium]